MNAYIDYELDGKRHRMKDADFAGDVGKRLLAAESELMKIGSDRKFKIPSPRQVVEKAGGKILAVITPRGDGKLDWEDFGPIIHRGPIPS